MIEVRNLQKHFGTARVVDDISFTAPDGAITGLLGANGAGKSTTLRIICGVLRPDSGVVHADRIGALLDHTGIYPRLTVRENLEYFGGLQGIEQPLLRQRADEIIGMLGLGSAADRKTAGFSQGERVKAALGRALVHAPRNLLLDEPTNGLDVPSVSSFHAFLKRLRDEGACIIFSSHRLEEVRTLCNRVIVIAKGRLVAQGSPNDLCADADSFVKLIC